MPVNGYYTINTSDYARRITNMLNPEQDPSQWIEAGQNVWLNRHTGRTTYSSGNPAGEQVSTATLLRHKKAQEVEALQSLLASGTPGDLSMYVDREGSIKITSWFGIRNVKWLAIMRKNKLFIPDMRTRHLRDILTAIAESEGLKLEVVNSMPEFDADKSVVFYPFQGMETDDSGLLEEFMPDVEALLREPQREDVWRIDYQAIRNSVLEEMPF